MRTWLARVLTALSLAALTGCANMAAIKEFGKISADAANYQKLTAEFGSMPTRGKLYTFASEDDARKTMDAAAERRKPSVKAANLFQATLSEYMTTVADLASDEAVSFDTEIGALADAALAKKYIEEREAKAVKTIGGIIASATTDFYRQRKLKEVIGDADAPLQIVVVAMVDLVNKAFVASLEDEQALVRGYYQNLEQRARHEDRQLAAAERIYAEGAQKQVELAESIAAARAYAKTLQNIGVAHHELYKQRDKVSDAEVQRQLKQYVRKIWLGYKATRKEAAFSDETVAAAK